MQKLLFHAYCHLVITSIRRCGKSYLLNTLFYHHLLENGVDADHIIRFAFDSADDLYLIGESLIQIGPEAMQNCCPKMLPQNSPVVATRFICTL